jgi:hypothetical protein
MRRADHRGGRSSQFRTRAAFRSQLCLPRFSLRALQAPIGAIHELVPAQHQELEQQLT